MNHAKPQISLYQGDSSEVLRKLGASSVELTVTSPPYDNLRTYNGYSFDFEAIAKELWRVTKIGGVVVWVVGDATCPIPDVCIAERRLPLFIARATLRELIAGLEARATGGAAR